MPEHDASRIAEALEATRAIVTELDKRSRDFDHLIREAQSDLRRTVEIVGRLQVLVWTGNGQDSLVTRITLTERSLTSLNERMKSAEHERTKTKTALITSMVALIGTLGAAAIALMK